MTSVLIGGRWIRGRFFAFNCLGERNRTLVGPNFELHGAARIHFPGMGKDKLTARRNTAVTITGRLKRRRILGIVRSRMATGFVKMHPMLPVAFDIEPHYDD